MKNKIIFLLNRCAVPNVRHEKEVAGSFYVVGRLKQFNTEKSC